MASTRSPRSSSNSIFMTVANSSLLLSIRMTGLLAAELSWPCTAPPLFPASAVALARTVKSPRASDGANAADLALHSDDGARQGPGRGLNAAAIEAQRAILDDEVSDLCKWMTSRRAMSPGNLSAAGASDTSQRSAYRGPSRGVQGSMRARL